MASSVNGQSRFNQIVADETSTLTYSQVSLKKIAGKTITYTKRTLLWNAVYAIGVGLFKAVREASWQQGPRAFGAAVLSGSLEYINRVPWGLVIGINVALPIADKLYQELCKGPDFDNYKSWYISRIGVLSTYLQIPEQYHEDKVLQQTICPLCRFPIRIPVRDPLWKSV